MGGQRCDVQVVDGGLLRRQRRQLVEVSGKQAEGADFGGDVFADGPGQAEAVVRGSASAELIDDDERVLRGRAGGGRAGMMRKGLFASFGLNKLVCLVLPQNGSRLQHLRHKGGDSFDLAVSRSHPGQDAVDHAEFRLLAWHEAADLSHQGDHTHLADKRRLAAHIWSYRQKKRGGVTQCPS